MARKGRLVSGFISGTFVFCAAFFVTFLWLVAGEARAALADSVSTADSSTAEGVFVVGKAVAAFPLTGTAACVVGLLNISSNVERCSSVIGFGASKLGL